MTTRQRWMLCGMLAAVHLARVAAVREPASVDLAIEMRDLARVPSGVMRDTKVEVERTFLAAGVRIVWIDAGASAHHTPLKLFMIGGATASRGIDPSTAMIAGVASQSDGWAQVFYRRVADAVAERQVPLSVVLAHVVSHELGHLLLPPDSHAPFGVMRREVDLEHPTLRRFTTEQSRLIRVALSTGRRYAWPCDQKRTTNDSE